MDENLKEAIMAKTHRLQEAVKRDGDLDWKIDFVEKAKSNALYRRVMKEMVLSDVSQALGVVHDVAIEAAKKMAVGRDIIWMVPTTQPTVRFYLAKRGKAWRISEGPPLQTPERFSIKDINVDHEYGYDALFSQSYLEDVPFNVIQRAIQDAAQLLEEQLTKDIISLYEGISASNLAGGAEVSAATNGTLAWEDLVAAWTALKKAGYTANIALIHPDQIADLWSDDKFIHSFYWGDKVDVARGVLGDTYLGFRIVETDLCTATKVHLIDMSKAAVLLMRRDILTQPYEERLSQGVVCTMRYGLGTLREDAVARIVNA
ncbi:MAG: hypothetical protein DRI26_05415 [Chloroflexi bacterium]|nr:MAG: hypothetical protein DRI26_05415 [Chloroflexota bacterium]